MVLHCIGEKNDYDFPCLGKLCVVTTARQECIFCVRVIGCRVLDSPALSYRLMSAAEYMVVVVLELRRGVVNSQRRDVRQVRSALTDT